MERTTHIIATNNTKIAGEMMERSTIVSPVYLEFTLWNKEPMIFWYELSPLKLSELHSMAAKGTSCSKMNPKTVTTRSDECRLGSKCRYPTSLVFFNR